MRAYYGAVLAAENLKAAEQAVRSAEADLKRAESVRAAGMSTDVDVLSIRVHLAAVTEQRIDRAADLDVAKAALNDALGLPLDTPARADHAARAARSCRIWRSTAWSARPPTRARKRRETHLATSLAQTQAERRARRDAAAGELPRRVRSGPPAVHRSRRRQLAGRHFAALEPVQRIAPTRRASKKPRTWSKRAESDEQRADSAIRLQVRRAYAGLRAAQQRIEVAKAAVAEAEESLRITQNRYEAGMSNVTDLLRTETAVLETRTRYLAAIHDQRIAATMLEFAAGRLDADSEVLN